MIIENLSRHLFDPIGVVFSIKMLLLQTFKSFGFDIQSPDFIIWVYQQNETLLQGSLTAINKKMLKVNSLSAFSIIEHYIPLIASFKWADNWLIAAAVISICSCASFQLRCSMASRTPGKVFTP